MTARFRFLLAGSVVVALAACSRAQIRLGTIPPDATCVAVLPFEVRFDATPANEMLSEFLALELVQGGASGVLGPMEAAKLFREAKDPLPPIIDPYWARVEGEKLGVDTVIFGSLTLFPVVRTDGFEKVETILINADVYLIQMKTGLINWTYGTKEEVRAEGLSRRLSDHAFIMASSLLRNRKAAVFSGKNGCWKALSAPAGGAAKKKDRAVAAPTAPPLPPLAPKLTAVEEKLLAALKQGTVVLSGKVFRERTAQLTKDGIVRLRELASVLTDLEAPPTVQIGGHVDATESVSGDLSLSRQRAQAIRTYLIDLGIDTERLKAVGFGGTRPVVPNLTEKSRLLNRRTEISPVSGRRR